jgi:hypothetical protein
VHLTCHITLIFKGHFKNSPPGPHSVSVDSNDKRVKTFTTIISKYEYGTARIAVLCEHWKRL